MRGPTTTASTRFYHAFYRWTLLSSVNKSSLELPGSGRALHQCRKCQGSIKVRYNKSDTPVATERRLELGRSTGRPPDGRPLRDGSKLASRPRSRSTQIKSTDPKPPNEWLEAKVQTSAEKPFDTLEPGEEAIRYRSSVGIMIQVLLPAHVLVNMQEKLGQKLETLSGRCGARIEVGTTLTKDGKQFTGLLYSGSFEEAIAVRTETRAFANTSDQRQHDTHLPVGRLTSSLADFAYIIRTKSDGTSYHEMVVPDEFWKEVCAYISPAEIGQKFHTTIKANDVESTNRYPGPRRSIHIKGEYHQRYKTYAYIFDLQAEIEPAISFRHAAHIVLPEKERAKFSSQKSLTSYLSEHDPQWAVYLYEQLRCRTWSDGSSWSRITIRSSLEHLESARKYCQRIIRPQGDIQLELEHLVTELRLEFRRRRNVGMKQGEAASVEDPVDSEISSGVPGQGPETKEIRRGNHENTVATEETLMTKSNKHDAVSATGADTVGSEADRASSHDSARPKKRVPNEIKSVLRTLTHPVVLITSRAVAGATQSDTLEAELDHARGVTVSSFNTVTISPHANICFNLKTPSRTWDAISTSETLCAHVLAASPAGARVAQTFTQPYEDPSTPFHQLLASGIDMRKGRMEGTPAHRLRCPVNLACRGANGPVLSQLFARVQMDKCVHVGDHVVVVAKVTGVNSLRTSTDMEGGLAYASMAYRGIGPVVEAENLDSMQGIGSQERSALDHKDGLPINHQHPADSKKEGATDCVTPSDSDNTNGHRVEAPAVNSDTVARSPAGKMDEDSKLARAIAENDEYNLSFHDEIGHSEERAIKSTSLEDYFEQQHNEDLDDLVTAGQVDDPPRLTEAVEQDLGQHEAVSLSYPDTAMADQQPVVTLDAELAVENPHELVATEQDDGNQPVAQGASNEAVSQATAAESVTLSPGKPDSRHVRGDRDNAFAWGLSAPQKSSYSTISLRCLSPNVRHYSVRPSPTHDQVADPSLLKQSVADFLGTPPGWVPPLRIRRLLRLQQESEAASERLSAGLADGTLTADNSAKLERTIAENEQTIAKTLARNSAKILKVMLNAGNVNERRAQWLEQSVEKGQAVLTQQAKLLRAALDAGQLSRERFVTAKTKLEEEYGFLRNEAERLKATVVEEGDEGVVQDDAERRRRERFDGFRANV